MNIVPGFLLKKIYQKGSLQETKEGVVFKLKNILGPGIVTGINFIKINDKIYNSSVIRIIKSGASTVAEQISTDNPMLIKLNEEITCVIESCLELQEGLNKVMVELISKDVGKVNVTVSDMV